MKKKTLGILMGLFVYLGFAGFAFAHSLFLKAEDPRTGLEKTTFQKGEEFLLHIKIDDHRGIAACAFTLNYPPEALTTPETNPDGTPAVAYDIVPVFRFLLAMKQHIWEIVIKDLDLCSRMPGIERGRHSGMILAGTQPHGNSALALAWIPAKIMPE